MTRHFPAAGLGVDITIAPQQRGDEEYFGSALERLVTRLGAPRLVCGVSLGAHLAVRLAAADAPHLGDLRLLLCLPAAFDTGTAPGNQRTPAAEPDPADYTDPESLEPHSPSDDWVGREVLRARHLLTPGQLRTGLAAGARSRGPTPEDLHRIRARTTIVAWPDDPLHPLDVAYRWAEEITDAQLVTVTRTAVERDTHAFVRALNESR